MGNQRISKGLVIVSAMARSASATFFILSLLTSSAWAEPRVVEAVDVATVWAGHPVDFCLLTHGERQFVAYYDAERQMIVAQRLLFEKAFSHYRLPEQTGWDSHNYITMAMDADGYLHLSGNMHVHLLAYFRSRAPLDASTLERTPAMVGENEDRVTYPQFISRPDGSLVFTYRDGSSGSGNQIYNVYDTATKQWRRLLDTPLTDGLGKMNAYFDGPFLGPDGFFHLCWVWRDTPDCATNHDVCYARSKDLQHWENSVGNALTLPISPDTSEVIDPVPPGGGLINVNARVGFDGEDRVVLAYHKYDDKGRTQLFVARRESGGWNIRQITSWDYRWEFSGGGAIEVEISVSPAKFEPGVGLVIPFVHKKEGRGRVILNEATLEPLETQASLEFNADPTIMKIESSFPGMQVNTARDLGRATDEHGAFVLRWETLGANRDKPRSEPLPPPSKLQVLWIEK